MTQTLNHRQRRPHFALCCGPYSPLRHLTHSSPPLKNKDFMEKPRLFHNKMLPCADFKKNCWKIDWSTVHGWLLASVFQYWAWSIFFYHSANDLQYTNVTNISAIMAQRCRLRSKFAQQQTNLVPSQILPQDCTWTLLRPITISPAV